MVSPSTQTRIVNEADTLRSETIEFLQEMVRTKSVNPPGDYENIRQVITSWYEEFGWDVETVWVPDELLEAHDFSHPRPNILGYVTKGDGPTIALNAHIDTVPVNEEEWTVDPFGGEIRDGRLWGRGTKDSKGRIASYTLAARILQETNLLPDDVTIVLAMTADEEIGGETGAKYVTDCGALRPDYAIVEGAGWNEIWHAASGIFDFRINVEGKTAHAGTRPDQGANAILGAGRILTRLEEYASTMSLDDSDVANAGPTCVPAVIEGGVKLNVVPASCTIDVNRRVPPDHDVDEAEREFKEIINEVELPDGVRANAEVMRRSDPYNFDLNEPQIRAVGENANAILDIDVPVVGTRGSTDARHWAANGAQCVNYGSGDDNSNAHAADERVVLDQVIDVGAVLAGSIIDIAEID